MARRDDGVFKVARVLAEHLGWDWKELTSVEEALFVNAADAALEIIEKSDTLYGNRRNDLPPNSREKNDGNASRI